MLETVQDRDIGLVRMED